VVAANSVIVGELAVSDHLLVDGRVEGRIRADLQVSIGRTGVVQGELSARHVIVCGRFEGSIDADRLEIVAGGSIRGDITVAALTMEPGAHFTGTSRFRKPGEQPGSRAQAVSANPGHEKASPQAGSSKNRFWTDS